MPKPSAEIRPLTSLRFFAAAIVFCEHVQMIPGTGWIHTATGWPGKAGVSLFFVLSGFILNYSYGEYDWTGAFRKTSRDYFVGRLARIYPLHWLMFVVALPLGLNSNTARVRVADFPWLLTLTDRMWPGYTAGNSPVKVAWTLSCEAVFYVLVPLILWFLRDRRRPLAASVALWAGCGALVFLLVSWLPTLNWSGYVFLPEFLVGIVGYQWYRRPESRGYGHLLLIGGLLLMAAWVMIERAWSNPYSFLGYAPGSLGIILGCADLRGPVGRFLSWTSLVLLGNASYALYLIHDPVLRYTKVLLDRRGVVLPFWLSVVAAVGLFVVCCGLAILCYLVYETPLRLKVRAWFHNYAKPAPVAAAPSLS